MRLPFEIRAVQEGETCALERDAVAIDVDVDAVAAAACSSFVRQGSTHQQLSSRNVLNALSFAREGQKKERKKTLATGQVEPRKKKSRECEKKKFVAFSFFFAPLTKKS